MALAARTLALEDSVMRLAGKITVVTGAASGIGAAIAGRFAAEGAETVAADRACAEESLASG